MDEYTDDEAQEASAEETPAAIDDKYVRKLKDENQSLRQRLRRTELEANFGKDVVELIPEELPLSKWEEFAGKLAERMPKAVEAEQTEPAPEDTSQEEEPTKLAAVATSPSSGAPTAGELMTTAEIKELAKSDPVAAARLMNEGKFQPAKPW